MDAMMNVSAGHAGWLVWVVWFLIGLIAAMMAQRFTGGRRTFLFDLVIGIVAAVLGGYLSICYIGGGPVQLFLVSVLGAIFFAAAALWITGALIAHFRRDENT